MESAGVRHLRTRCFCIRNLTRSLRSLVRFLIRQQLVRKYRTPALSMKYSLYTEYPYLSCNIPYTRFKSPCIPYIQKPWPTLILLGTHVISQ